MRILLLSCVVGLLVSESVPCLGASERPPNILFLMADDHAAHAIGAYGGRLAALNPTPTLDRLAREGTRLSNAFCTNSICVPSRATILTGQFSHRNGVKTLSGSLPPERQMLPRLFHEAGYETALIGKWHLGAEPAAFDHYCVPPAQGSYFNPTFHAGMAKKRVPIRWPRLASCRRRHHRAFPGMAQKPAGKEQAVLPDAPLQRTARQFRKCRALRFPVRGHSNSRAGQSPSPGHPWSFEQPSVRHLRLEPEHQTQHGQDARRGSCGAGAGIHLGRVPTVLEKIPALCPGRGRQRGTALGVPPEHRGTGPDRDHLHSRPGVHARRTRLHRQTLDVRGEPPDAVPCQTPQNHSCRTRDGHSRDQRGFRPNPPCHGRNRCVRRNAGTQFSAAAPRPARPGRVVPRRLLPVLDAHGQPITGSGPRTTN